MELVVGPAIGAALGVLIGVAIGLRLRAHQIRAARWQRYLAGVRVAASNAACRRALNQLGRWRDTYYASRANRHGWPERLP